MPKKFLFIALTCVLTIAVNHATAQVYTITAKYSVAPIYSPNYGGNLWFDRIDTAHHYTFIIDIDKKTLSNPIYRNPPELISFSEIIHDESNHFYILKYKPERHNRWNYYKLQLTADNDPLYLQLALNSTISHSARDTFFDTYTNDLTSLSFAKKYTRIKDVTLDKDNYAANDQIRGLVKIPFRETNEPLEMRNGYINWTREGVTHHLLISSAELVKGDDANGIDVQCAERDGEYYDLAYINSDRKVDESQYGKEPYIMILKYVNGKKVWVGILE